MSVFSGPGPFKKGVNDGFFQGYSNVDGIMTLSDSQLMSLGDSLFVSVLARSYYEKDARALVFNCGCSLNGQNLDNLPGCAMLLLVA